MDFKRIRHFVTVAEARSLTKAAERLHIVQPAISQSIKKLEEEMGAVLFIRSRRGMELTEAGAVFLKSAYGILNQFNRSKENVAAVGKKPTGLVSIAMTASALNVLSIPITEILQVTYPDVQLNLEEGLTGSIQLGLESGWYDLVINFDPDLNDSVHVEELILEDLYLVVPYEKSSPANIPFSQVKKYPLIIPKDQGSIGHILEEYAKQTGETINVSNITAAMHPALQLVEGSLGYTVLPWSGIYDRVKQKHVSARKISSPPIQRRVSMIYPTQRPLTQGSIAVMEVVRLAVKKAHADGHWHGELLY